MFAATIAGPGMRKSSGEIPGPSPCHPRSSAAHARATGRWCSRRKRRCRGIGFRRSAAYPCLASLPRAGSKRRSSPQLAQDRAVAERDGLELTLVEGDMADLRAFASESFDLVFHPCSNCFVPDVLPVWREAFRVLRPGGVLLAGFVNPVAFLFDDVLDPERRELVVRHRIPYSDLTSLGPRLAPYLESNKPLTFGHTLRDQIGGQLEAGFVLERMFEDTRPSSDGDPLSEYISAFIATRALRPR